MYGLQVRQHINGRLKNIIEGEREKKRELRSLIGRSLARMYHLKKQIDATLDSVQHHPSSMIWRAEKDGIRINKWSLKVGFRMDVGDG